MLHHAVYEVVLDMSSTATAAEPGNEAEEWSTNVTMGVCIPMFENKGDRNDKSNWDHFATLVHRQEWVGHVARMHVSRAPKFAVFGWPTDLEAHRSCRLAFPQWVKRLLQKYGISGMDWFRLAQKPTGRWLQLLDNLGTTLR